MATPSLRPRSPSLPHRILSATVAVLVWMLSVLAVSPQLHADLHACGHDHGHTHDAPGAAPAGDDGCVITLFGQGITAAPAPFALPEPASALGLPAVSSRPEIFLSPPRYLHQPERGPPLS